MNKNSKVLRILRFIPEAFLGILRPREVKVTQKSLTLCDPMGYTVHGTLQARILEWGSFSLLWGRGGIFRTQGSNPGLAHCRQILYQLSHRETQEHWSG